MGTTEKPDNRLYEQPTESPGECPYCSLFTTCYRCGVRLNPDTIWTGDMPTCDSCPPVLLCSTCGVILNPVEVKLDVGDGPELLCDDCLLGSRNP